MLRRAFDKLPHDTIIIEGAAKGCDRFAREEARSRGMTVMEFPANWRKYGRGAGPIRNQQMLDETLPDVVLAFHDDLPNSRGTRDMVRRAQRMRVPVWLHTRKEVIRLPSL